LRFSCAVIVLSVTRIVILNLWLLLESSLLMVVYILVPMERYARRAHCQFLLAQGQLALTLFQKDCPVLATIYICAASRAGKTYTPQQSALTAVKFFSCRGK
jgi:hypothetical protein